MSDISGKGTALITGASAGLGAVYADRLAKRGYDLVLVARRADRLERIAERLTAETGRAVRPMAADLTDPDDLRKTEEVLRSDASITMLVNNAGFGSTASLLSIDLEVLRRMIALNIAAPAGLVYAAAIAFAARGRGTIVNIASGVALAPEILNGIYGGSKAFLYALSRALHHELASHGVRVQAVLPGATATDFWETAGTPLDHLPKDIVMSAEDAVDAALAGLDQGESVTIPSLPLAADWDTFEKARAALIPKMSLAAPAARYGLISGTDAS